MWRAASVVLLALAVPGSFPAMSGGTLRQHYGQPISETFLIRPGVVATATYGPDGQTCELLIAPKQSDGLIKNWPGAETIPYETLKEVENELVPSGERGKFKIAGFDDLMCGPDNSCWGTQQQWEKIVEYSNSGKNGARYAVIQWLRKECGHHGAP